VNEETRRRLDETHAQTRDAERRYAGASWRARAILAALLWAAMLAYALAEKFMAP